MASIRQRGDTWQVRVSRMGFPSESRTFCSKAEARRWATEVEAAMLRGTHNPNAGTNAMALRDLLARYAQEGSPGKRGYKDELIRIQADSFFQAENWIPSDSIQAGLQKIQKPTYAPRSHANQQYVARFIVAHWKSGARFEHRLDSI